MVEEEKMKLFDKPRLLKPEINEPKYYIHLVVIAVFVLGVLQYLKGGEMLTIKNVLWSIPLLLFGDIIAHTLLGLD